jgi:hypothetical protein
MKTIYLLILLLFICIVSYYMNIEMFTGNFFNRFNSNVISNGIRESVSNFGVINREIENVGRFWNGIAQDWIPNVGWIYRYRDKSIELARARRGLPPLQAAIPDVKINLNSSNNRYSTGFSP